MDAAYYNEFDPYAAQWLRNLIKAGHIAPGFVDERSIEDVTPDDLKEFKQCHFFAGIGVWSFALRRAGWDDSRPIWTASCPCQPFSAAGIGAALADPRHLWPSLFWLIAERRPAKIVGEQVASPAVGPWVDLVQADLETVDYAFGAVPFPSASVGAPHIRDRIYWVGDPNNARLSDSKPTALGRARRRIEGGAIEQSGRAPGGLANLHSDGRNQARDCEPSAGNDGIERNGAACRVADTAGTGLEQQLREPGQRQPAQLQGLAQGGGIVGMADADHVRLPVGDIRSSVAPGRQGPGAQAGRRGNAAENGSAGAVYSMWSAADWLLCRDGKWRPVEPGTFPLANGAPNRVGRLRAYGNAVNAAQAQIFIESLM